MTSVLANASAFDRDRSDFYPTPDSVTEAFLKWAKIPDSATIWEPAAGEGHMAECLRRHGYNVVPTTLHDQGYGQAGVNFLHQEKTMGQFIITNPPFRLATEFIEHAMTMGVPFAMLLKSQFWHAASRKGLFNSHKPMAVLPLTWRPDFHFGRKGGSPTMEVLWTVWGVLPAPYTEYVPLERPS